MSQDSFIFYRSFYDAVKKLNNDDFANAMRAICVYALDGEVIEMEGVPEIVFTMAKPQIDANIKRREDGKKGGRPKKEKTSGFESEKPMVSKKKTKGYVTEKPNVNVNVNENVNVNANANQNENGKSINHNHNIASDIPEYEEVEAFAAKINRAYKKPLIDAEKFWNYYNDREWMIEGEPVQNWKALMMSWKNNIEYYNDPLHVVP